MSKKNKVDNTIHIIEKVVFEFAFLNSATTVANAVMQVGFYAKITTNDMNQYVLTVYTDRI